MGMTPNGRKKSKFKDLAENVHQWVENLNCNEAYAPFHKLRKATRDSSGPGDEYCEAAPSGKALLPGLKKYNPRGDAYLAEVQNLMDKTYDFSAMDQLWRESEMEKCGLIQVQLKRPDHPNNGAK